jgi:hypothetical protein
MITLAGPHFGNIDSLIWWCVALAVAGLTAASFTIDALARAVRRRRAGKAQRRGFDVITPTAANSPASDPDARSG